MSDERLRDLERRWKEAGSTEAEAPWLLERLRTGDASHEMAVVAAYCGHAPARVALGKASPRIPDDWEERAEELAARGREVSVRAGIAVALVGLPDFLEHYSRDGASVERVVIACEEWVYAPDWSLARDAAELGESLRRSWHLSSDPLAWVPSAIASAAASTLHEPRLSYWSLAQDVPEERIWHGIRAEVVPWALGYSDPVRTRVAGRAET